MKKINILLIALFIMIPISFQVGKSASTEKIIIKHFNKNLIIKQVSGTYYNPVVTQCDSDPLITADNSFINLNELKNENIRWVALSRNLIKRWGGPFNYGDTIYVHHDNKQIQGLWVVRDCMNARFINRIDFLVHENKQFPGFTKDILISNIVF